jgi:hypothetical protein
VDLREQLQSIYDQHARLTPELVVQAARPKDHPLHARVFDRPPREAAEEYYRARAAELIRSVRIVYREATETEPQRTVRAFHAVATGDGVVYEPVERVVSDGLLRELVLRDMERDWKDLYRRYGHFQEFLELVNSTMAAAPL